MAFNESNSEETHWKKVLETYERVPSDRAKRQFQTRLTSQPRNRSKAWIWGIAAGISMVGAWWMFQPTSELSQSSLAIQEHPQFPNGNKQVGKIDEKPSTLADMASSSVIKMEEVRVEPKERVRNVKEFDQVVSMPVSEHFSQSEETEVVSRLGLDVAPLRGKDIRMGIGSYERQLEITGYVATTSTSENFKRNGGLGQFIEELMILKYGEPVEDKPTLAALLAGEEKNLLAAERAELKERFSWIKDRVTK